MNGRARRCTSGQYVYILANRIPTVAKRKHPRNTAARATLVQALLQEERNNIMYIARTHFTTKWTGMLTIVAPDGTTYKVHNTDVVRV